MSKYKFTNEQDVFYKIGEIAACIGPKKTIAIKDSFGNEIYFNADEFNLLVKMLNNIDIEYLEIEEKDDE